MLFFLILFILNITLIICFDKFSRFVNLFDIPDGLRKLHKQPIASIGGVIIFINLLFYFIYTQYRYFNFNIDNFYFTNFLTKFFIELFLDKIFLLLFNKTLFFLIIFASPEDINEKYRSKLS
jgi:UDP-N-acetylmuramyl pentapeptide phosphotransferase/UDP-N-acetylglucosamine-1-phosphate transferase